MKQRLMVVFLCTAGLAAAAATSNDVAAIATALGGTRIEPQLNGATAIIRADGRRLTLQPDAAGNLRVTGAGSDLTFVRDAGGGFRAVQQPPRRLAGGRTVQERAADHGELADHAKQLKR